MGEAGIWMFKCRLSSYHNSWYFSLLIKQFYAIFLAIHGETVKALVLYFI